MTKKLSRPALRYFGGKWRLAPWIISYFPQHEVYIEPCCGGASVFLQKPKAVIEVINDLDSEVVNFFRVLRDYPDDLVRMIQKTPYSREVYMAAFGEPRGLRYLFSPRLRAIERALRYYVRSWQGWGGNKNGATSWRRQLSNNRGKSVVRDWTETEHLFAIADRLREAFVEHDDMTTIIERYDKPGTLFYVDPPYLSETRTQRWRFAYRHEIDEQYHFQLLRMLTEVKGMVALSGYPSRLYDELLSGWERVETVARTTNTSNTVTEVLWLSPSIAQSRLPLFAGL